MDSHYGEYLTSQNYTYGELKVLGKGIKAELEKIKMFNVIKRSKEQETREVKRTIECILDNTFELMTPEDAKRYLTRKLQEISMKQPSHGIQR